MRAILLFAHTQPVWAAPAHVTHNVWVNAYYATRVVDIGVLNLTNEMFMHVTKKYIIENYVQIRIQQYSFC